jgi:hypothetical protein
MAIDPLHEALDGLSEFRSTKSSGLQFRALLIEESSDGRAGADLAVRRSCAAYRTVCTLHSRTLADAKECITGILSLPNIG